MTLHSPPQISSPSFPALLCPAGEGLTSGDDGAQAQGLGLLAEMGRQRLRRKGRKGRKLGLLVSSPLPSGLSGEARPAGSL